MQTYGITTMNKFLIWFALIMVILLSFSAITGCEFDSGDNETEKVSLWSCREPNKWNGGPPSTEWPCTEIIDFGSQTALDELTLRIGEWQTSKGDQTRYQVLEHEDVLWQSYKYDQPPWKESIGVDVTLLRQYMKSNTTNGETQSIWLLLMHSENSQIPYYPLSLHYPARGWEVGDEGNTEVTFNHPSWHDDLKNPCLRLSKLVVSKGTDEHRMVLYFYLDDDQSSPEMNGIIRVSTNMPSNTDKHYEQTEDTLKEFLATIFPYLFEPTKN